MFSTNQSLKRGIRFIFFMGLLGLGLISCGNAGTGKIGTPDATVTPSPTTSPTASASVPHETFRVTGVDMSVSPSSIAGLSCGTALIVNYTATFHVTADTSGGTVQFEYTTNNGHASTEASMTFGPGEVTKNFTFSWSGQLTEDNVVPGMGGVIVSAPNSLHSSLMKPTGTCTPTAGSGSADFRVTGVDLVPGASLSGHACGSQFTETYTATFHIQANSPGGNLVFRYTLNNGRSDNGPITLHVNPGQQSITYSFNWSGPLPEDHTMPGTAIVMLTAPNSLTSAPAGPQGACS